MGNPITFVELSLQEAKSDESCVTCGLQRKGMSAFIVNVSYIDPADGQEMIAVWSFPLYQEHILEVIAKHPEGKELLSQELLADFEDQTGSNILPPPFFPYHIPHAN